MRYGIPLTDETLAIWLDGEGGWRLRRRVWLALLASARVRRRVRALRADRDRASALFSAFDVPADTQEAWARFVIRSGAGVARSTSARSRGRHALLAWAAVVLLVAPFATERFGMSLQPPEGPPSAARFDGDLHVLWRTLGVSETAAVVRDVCCADYDSGGPADDGVLTLNYSGEWVAAVVLYEDLDGNGGLSSGDVVRFAARGPSAPRAVAGSFIGGLSWPAVNGRLLAAGTYLP